MANVINVKASKRENRGTAAARRLRKSGVMPAVLCDEKGQATSIQLNTHDFELMLGKHAGESLLIDLMIDDQPARKVLLREVQHDPVRGVLQHADFVEISLTRKLHISVPIELTGEPVGVTQQGGMLDQSLREVEIECLPADIIEEVTLDVSGLTLGESLYVRDIKLEGEAIILDDGDIAVATVAAPRIEEDETEAAAEGGQAEPEVISGRKERDDEDAQEGKGKE